MCVKRGDLARACSFRWKGCVARFGLPCLALAARTQRAAGRHRGGEFARSPALAGQLTTEPGVLTYNGTAVQPGQKHTALMAAVAAVDVGMTYYKGSPMYIGIGALLLIIILVVVLL